jgi:ElaB/YqjD/DUF883 family membrane-anchored ribosome-binding protein
LRGAGASRERDDSHDFFVGVKGLASTINPEKVKSMENQFNQATGRYSAAAHQTVDRLAENAHPAVDRLAEGAHEAVDRLAGMATTTAERIGRQAEQLNASRQRLGDSCSAYVHDNPLTSIGLAVAAGYLLSRLLGSR